MRHIKCCESLTIVINITTIKEASALCSFSEVVNNTESIEVFDKSFSIADEAAHILLQVEDKDNEGNGNSQLSQPKYGKRKETESAFNWVGANKS